MTCTSVGESSTMRIRAIPCSERLAAACPGMSVLPSERTHVGFDRIQELVLRERLCQIVLRTDDATARAIEQTVFARQHDDWNGTEDLVVLDERAGLIAVEPRHHDVDEDNVRLMIRDLRQRIEAVDCGV